MRRETLDMFDLEHRALVEQKEILLRCMRDAARYENHAEKRWCIERLKHVDDLLLAYYNKPTT